MIRFRIHFFSVAVAILFTGCNPIYQSTNVKYKGYSIQKYAADSSLQLMLKPYSDSVNGSMNIVIAKLAHEVEKKQPEGTLGNLMADGMKIMGEKYYGVAIDAAFINSGGVRLQALPAGNITRGKVFELMPFDNIIILQKLKGSVLQEFLNEVAKGGGWPVSGLTMQIKDKKAVNVMIGNQPLNLNSTYTIANSDYIAGSIEVLKPLPQINNGSLLRDALLDYFSSFTKAGKEISVQIQNRITNAQ